MHAREPVLSSEIRAWRDNVTGAPQHRLRLRRPFLSANSTERLEFNQGGSVLPGGNGRNLSNESGLDGVDRLLSMLTVEERPLRLGTGIPTFS